MTLSDNGATYGQANFLGGVALGLIAFCVVAVALVLFAAV